MAYTDDSGDKSREQWATYVPPELDRELSKYRDERELSKSATARRLIKQGLDEPSARERRAQDIKQLADHLVGIGLVAFLAGSFGPSGGIIVGLTLGLSFATVSAVAYLLQAYLKEDA